MKLLAVAVLCWLAGYGAASLGMEIQSQREALRLRDMLDELDTYEVIRRTTVTDTAPIGRVVHVVH